MKNLESAIEKFQSKVKGLNFQSKDPFQLIELKRKIEFYEIVAYTPNHWDDNVICDAANRIHEFIFETYKFNSEWDEDMANYLLKATDIEAANYLMDEFFPRFEQFIKEYVEWYRDGNVVKMGEDNYIEQTTQWKKKFTEEELMKFYVKEYCSVNHKLI